MPNLFWFPMVFILLFVGWLFYVGPQDFELQRPFLEPPPPLGSGGTYGPKANIGKFENKNTNVVQGEGSTTGGGGGSGAPGQDTLFGGQVTLYASYSNSTNPNLEYLKIYASPKNTNPINISGWRLRSAVSGKEVTIGTGTYLFYSGTVNSEQPIFLNPGDQATIVTGRSPVGVSFKLNTCTGFLEQFQDFVPALPQQCPHPLEEDYPSGVYGLADSCIDYLKTFPRCAAHISAVPIQLGGSCQDFIGTINYTGCVERHKSDSGFYKQEWMVYLKRDQELWKDRRETIHLLSESGGLVSSVSY